MKSNESCFRIPVWASLLWILSATVSVQAADVAADISTRETFVGLPIVLRIQISNAVKHEAPVMPEVDGLTIESAGPASTSRRVTIINGQRSSRSTVTYSYLVTPQREGTFTIPPVMVTSDGSTTMTKAVRVVATKSETDDLLFVEITRRRGEESPSKVFVGQAIELTLKIWIRPYRDKQFRVTLEAGNMWSLLSNQTKWGPFGEAIESMRRNRQLPEGRPTLRQDSEGAEREYLLYEIDATVYPDRPGTIDGEDVRVIMNYPLELGRPRSPLSMFDDDDFFSGSGLLGSRRSMLVVTRSRPIIADSKVDAISVQPIPEEGRPANYRGAVGQYRIVAEAKPVHVKVGDPITLNFTIEGSGRMDVVRAPPLEIQSDLIRDFKVPAEPLAGFVEGTLKGFTTSIRPLHEEVSEIPPIEFCYFDPTREEFVTTQSAPIRIEVDEADVLSLDSIVGGQAASTNSTDSSQADAALQPWLGGVRFDSDSDVLRSTERPGLVSTPLLVAFLLPLLMVVSLVLYATRQHVGGLISARRQFHKSLSKATTSDEVASALERFLRRRFRISDGRVARDQTIGHLRAAGHADLAIRVERLYGNGQPLLGSDPIDDLRNEASSIVDAVLQGNVRAASKGKIGQLSTSSVLLFAAMIVAPLNAIAQSPEKPVPLSAAQQARLLDEATKLFTSGSDASDSTQAKELFAQAALKLQILADSGIHNDRIFANLAGAQLAAGDTAKAIANYRRALRFSPANQAYRNQLAEAETRLPDSAATRQNDEGLDVIRVVNDLLLRFVSPRLMLGIAVLAWWAAWAVVATRIMSTLPRWKAVVTVLLVTTLLSATSYGLRVTQFSRDNTAVLVDASASLREGDGVEFAPLRELSEAQGQLVSVLARRGDWFRIAFSDGTTGWIPADAAEEI